MLEIVESLAKAQDIGITWVVMGALGYISWSAYKKSQDNHIKNEVKIQDLNLRLDVVDEEKHKCLRETAVLMERQDHLTKRFEECVNEMMRGKGN